MSTSILYNAPSGFVGDCSRPDESNIEPVMQGAQCQYGAPYKFNGSGQAIPIAANDTATVFQGILTRIIPAQSGNTNQGFNDTIPWLEQPQGGLVRGYGMVYCTVGTPVRGGAVYMRVVANSPKAVGDLEASSDGSNSVLLTELEWASNGKDANNVAEVRIRA